MPRPCRPIVGLAIVAILLAPLLPGSAGLDWVFEPPWVLLPDEVVVPVFDLVTPLDEQPAPLLSLASPRAPPLRSLA